MSPSSFRHVLKGVLASLVTFALLLCVLEFCGYLWERKLGSGEMGWTLVGSRRIDLELRGGATPYTVLRPGSQYAWSGVTVSINSRGFRTEDFEEVKAKGSWRVLNVGDSNVFGWGIRQEDTYGKRLERLLNRDSERHFEVLNTGIPGWTITSARNFLLAEGLAYGPDILLLGVTFVNDIKGRNSHARAPAGLFEWLRDNTYMWPFLVLQTRLLLYGPERVSLLNPPKEASAYYPLSEESPVWAEVWRPIRQIREACEARGIRLILVLFPTAFQLHQDGHPDVPQRVFDKLARKASIELVDLLPIYRDACASAGEQACEGLQNLLFRDVWMHPNEKGNTLAAESILEALALSHPTLPLASIKLPQSDD